MRWVAGAAQRDVAQALVRLATQRFERLANPRAQVGIGDLDAVGFLQHELAQAIGAENVNAGALHGRLRLAAGRRQRLGDTLGMDDARPAGLAR